MLAGPIRATTMGNLGYGPEGSDGKGRGDYYSKPLEIEICENCPLPPEKCKGFVKACKYGCPLERYRFYCPSRVRSYRMPAGHLSVADAARMLGVTKEVVRQRIETGKLTGCRKLGSGPTSPWAIPAEALR